jgi:hypothetical protein
MLLKGNRVMEAMNLAGEPIIVLPSCLLVVYRFLSFLLFPFIEMDELAP